MKYWTRGRSGRNSFGTSQLHTTRSVLAEVEKPLEALEEPDERFIEEIDRVEQRIGEIPRQVNLCTATTWPYSGKLEISGQVRRFAAELPTVFRSRKKAQPVRSRQTQRGLTSEQSAELVLDYKASDDISVIATRWNLHRTTVAAHLRCAGVTLRRRGIPAGLLDEAVRCTTRAGHFSSWPSAATVMTKLCA